MSAIYGERFKIMNDHNEAHSAKLDAILAKNTEFALNTDLLEAKHTEGNAILSSMDGKVVACDTGSVTVSSSALPAGAASESTLSALSAKVTAVDTGSVTVVSSSLPSGASSEAKQDVLIGHVDGLEALVGATNTALAGTLTVSAPAVVKSTQQPIVAESVADASEYTSAEIDLGTAKHLAIVASCTDTSAFHEMDLLISPSSGGAFFETSHSGFFSNGFFHVHAENLPFRFVKLRVKNTSGSADTFDAHLLSSA